MGKKWCVIWLLVEMMDFLKEMHYWEVGSLVRD